MKRNLLILSTLALSGFAFGQVSINNIAPKATLDVTARATDATTAEGIIAPRLTGDQILAKDAMYDADQTGALIYATSKVTTPAGTKTRNITAAGYYYFNGTEWISANSNLGNLRLIGGANHITQDAGVGSNGTSVGTGNIEKSTDKSYSTIAIGASAGNSLTNGYRNIFVGTNVGKSTTTGHSNTIIGMPAFDQNTTGVYNTSLGQSTLRLSTTGSGNTAIGALAMNQTTTGLENTVLGYRALYENKTGNGNIAIGISSGQNITESSNNISIGNLAYVANGALSNQLSIGNLIYGNGLDGTAATISTGNVGIGVKAPSNRLHVTAAANPVRLEGLVAATTPLTDRALVVDNTGVVKVGPAGSANGDNTNDAWVNQEGKVVLGTLANGTAPRPAGTEFAALDSGFVGIGNQNPQRLLHLTRNDKGTPSMVVLDNPNTTDKNGASFSFRGTTTGTGGASFYEFASIQAEYNIHDQSSAASTMKFFTSSGKLRERMRITTEGFLGVGTGAPTNTLHVVATENPLRLGGLQAGASTDKIVTVDDKGVLRTLTAKDLALQTLTAKDLDFSGLPTFEDDITAGTGGLASGKLYRTSKGDLKIKL